MEHKQKENLAIIIQGNFNAIEGNRINTFIKKYFELQSNDHIEVFNNKYIFKNLNLLQNIDFHCNLLGKNKEVFINYHGLDHDFENYKYELFKSIPAKLGNEIAFFLYFYLNEISIIDRINLPSLIDGLTIERRALAQRYFKKNSLIYIHQGNEKALKRINNYFNIFGIIEADNDIIFNSYDEFMDYLNKA
jgi:hypothetical protein